MARSDMITVSVYLPDETTKKVFEWAAELDNRSVSNFMVTAGLEKAPEMGVERKSIARDDE